jgi:excinuclease ABC subunit A
VLGRALHEVRSLCVEEAAQFVAALDPPKHERRLVGESIGAIGRRLSFLSAVGLGYVGLSRPAWTLSAGEAQRVRLSALLGSGLTGLTVLLDEPTRGMHPCEVGSLVGVLSKLRDEGQTVIVVEHDLEVIRAADFVVDMGPGAGRRGGSVVASGNVAEVARSEGVTGAWLRGERPLSGRAESRRAPSGSGLVVRGARANNLGGMDVEIPLRCLVGVCGVSGSGKSSLCMDILGRVLAPRKITTSVAREPLEPGDHDAVENAPPRTLLLDQTLGSVSSPIKTLGLDGVFARIYAKTPEATERGLDEKTFRRGCPGCGGSGTTSMDMGFLPPVGTECETCGGTGAASETHDVLIRDQSFGDLLHSRVEEALSLWNDEERVARALTTLDSVGLGYLVLNQPARSLSGGERQRLRIARELLRPTSPEGTLYILDEPTLGQHLEDVARLVSVLDRLVQAGHSVLVVEHHPHLLAACDWLIELGPEGGPRGGRVIAAGRPAVVARGSTPTAGYLRPLGEIAG